MAEITDAGFVGKTENEYFDDEINLYLGIDPEWNLDESTPDGLKIAADAEVFADLDEQAKLAYDSKDPSKATGVDLNAISAITGTFRDFGTPSTITTVTLTGVDGTVVPAGSQVRSSADSTLWTLDSATTISGGTATGSVTAVESGATEASIGTITQIVDTVGGWQTVTNDTIATPGTKTQTDAQLRLTRAKRVGLPGNNQIDSMLGQIGAVDGVRRFKIYENDTDTPDGDGLPGHSIAPIVDGGTDDDVALAIYLKKNPGVTLHPASTPVVVTVTSPVFPSNTKDITFSRPTYVDILIVVEITDDGTLPNTTIQDVTDAILDYVQGDLVDASQGFNQGGFDIGENVTLSRFYTPINQVIGPYGNSYVSDLTLNGSAANVTIAFNELSRFTSGNITVTIV